MTIELSLTRTDRPNIEMLGGTPAVWGEGYQAFWMPNGFLLSLFECDRDFYDDSTTRTQEGDLGLNDLGLARTRDSIVSALRDLRQQCAVQPSGLKLRDGLWHQSSGRGDIHKSQFQDVFTRTKKLAKENSKVAALEDALYDLGVPDYCIERAISAAAKNGILFPKLVTTQTLSDVVLQFTQIDGCKVDLKLSARKNQLRRQAQYLTDAWKHPLLRPFTPKLIAASLREDLHLGALITQDTINPRSLRLGDLQEYQHLRSAVIGQLSKRLRVERSILLFDEYTTDIFNRTLAHLLLRDSMAKRVYDTDPENLVFESARIEDGLMDAKNQTGVRKFLKLLEIYKQIEPRLYTYAQEEATTLIHGDPRPENIWPSPYNARPTGDPLALRANPEFDLARMEAINPRLYANMYLHMQEIVAEVLAKRATPRILTSTQFQDRAAELSFASAMRVGTFLLKQGRNANNYLVQANHYARMIN